MSRRKSDVNPTWVRQKSNVDLMPCMAFRMSCMRLMTVCPPPHAGKTYIAEVCECGCCDPSCCSICKFHECAAYNRTAEEAKADMERIEAFQAHQGGQAPRPPAAPAAPTGQPAAGEQGRGAAGAQERPGLLQIEAHTHRLRLKPRLAPQ
ncbi:unnamed protein product [Prorocentrum cordatum]|uniref:Uncharacterized protein n=1 Tax=Prorocentrum cordatum TaxID=2364126 RepID=A0ABN9RSE8_9DINO|nr:unnamed protein product [Polarella glacialis]